MPDTPERGIGPSSALPVSARPQIVVAEPHADLVSRSILEIFGIDPRRVDESSELGLVLMDLDLAGARWRSGSPSLDELFAELYRHFEARFDDWVPTFGRNRDVSSVVSQHQTQPGVTPSGLGSTDDGDVSSEHQTQPGGDAEPVPVAPMEAAWDGRANRRAGAGVRVAIADTAVAGRPQLWGHVLAAGDALLPSRTDDILAEAGHGTFVTGLVVQAAPGATVHVERVLDVPSPEHSGSYATDSWDVAKRLVRLARDHVHVINLSLGCHTGDNKPPLVFARALERLGPDVVVVAAAGNFAPDEPVRPVWPAALDGVVAVGATDAEGERAGYSPDPERAPWVDVQAHGHHVVSVFLEGKVTTGRDAKGGPSIKKFEGFARWNGTSFAAARVSGLIASRTRPGHVSSRRAWEALIEEADRDGHRRDGRPWLM